MLTVENPQIGMFDARHICGQVIPEDSFYGLLANQGHRIVRDEDFAECYSADNGRPSIPPSILAKVLLMAYRDDLSDERVMDAVRFDLRYKVALNLAVDHPGFNPSTLTRFRARLILHGKERLVFERTLALARQLGLVSESVEQIADSTPMLGAAAVKDTVRLVRRGVKALIDAVDGEDAESADDLRQGLEFDYDDPDRKPDCDWKDKSARSQMLTRVAQDAQRALKAVEGAPALASSEVSAAAQTLGELIGQDFDVDEEGVPRLRRATVKDRQISTLDPEMRHGRKSSSTRFDGFKLHLAATNAQKPVITAVTVSSAGAHDGHVAKDLIDAQDESTRPSTLLGDTAYGDVRTREALSERGVEVLARLPEPPTQAPVKKQDFEISLVKGTVTCPAGVVRPIPTPRKDGRSVVTFHPKGCRQCPLKSSCCPKTRIRHITVNRREDLLIAARQALADPDRADGLRRSRPRVERLIGLVAHRYHARKARYVGTRRSTLQAAFAAALVNLNPIRQELVTAAA